jgi:hypothetical protein
MQAARGGELLFVKRHLGSSESAIGSHSFDWEVRGAWLFDRDRARCGAPFWSFVFLNCNPLLVWTRVRSGRGISLTLALTRLMRRGGL